VSAAGSAEDDEEAVGKVVHGNCFFEVGVQGVDLALGTVADGRGRVAQELKDPNVLLLVAVDAVPLA
jgi:hypothetical protein